MKEFVLKMRKGVYKAKRKREYLQLFSNAEALYLGQINLPLEERDEALLSEILKTMEFSASTLLQEQKSKRLSFKTMGWVPRIAVILSSVLMFFAISAGVAYACGVNVLDLVFSNSGGAMFVNIRSTDSPNPVKTPSIFTEEFVDFKNIDEAVAALAFSPMSLKTELPLTKVSGYSGQLSRIILLDYDNGKNWISFEAQDFYVADSMHDMTLPGDMDAYTTVEINSIIHYFMQNSGETVILWTIDSVLYKVDTNLNETDAIALLTKSYR
ncbi:MAG: DUF4367 domain-containing protein [Clostridia bacterium]